MNRSPIFWGIVEEHLDEAEFLFEAWERAVAAPDLSWHEVEQTADERLRAHLDGLVVAGGPATERLLLPGLAAEDAEPCRAAACALALLEAPGEEGAWQVLRALSVAKPGSGLRDGIARALEVTGRPGFDETLLVAVTQGGGGWIPELWSALEHRRADPGAGIADALQSTDPVLQAAAVRAAAMRPPEELWQFVGPLLDAIEGTVRLAAIGTTLTWGLLAGWERCLIEAQRGQPQALRWVGMLGGEAELDLLRQAVMNVESREAALQALGYSGRRAAAEECLRWMDHAGKRTARFAAEAFGAITGVDGYTEGFASTEAVEDDALPPLDEDLAGDLEDTVEDELPTPRQEAFVRWWEGYGHAFDAQQRYLRGRLRSLDEVGRCFESGSTRTGQWLRQELWLRSSGALRLNSPRIGLRVNWEVLATPVRCPLQRPVVWW